MVAEAISTRKTAILKAMGPWWQLPLVLLIWLVPALYWGKFFFGQGLNQIISLMLLPFALQIREPGKYSNRYLWLSILFAVLALMAQVNTLVFLATTLGFLFVLEYYWGKVGYLPALLFFLMTPFLSSWLTAFTFPLQIWQSAQLGELLGKLGMEVEVFGNRFLLGEKWFSVSEACLGIHILSMAFFLAVLVLTLFEDRRHWKWWEVGLCLLLAAFLAYVANFSRMLILVIFQSPADTLGHELIGLLALATFVGLPLYGLVWWQTRNIPQDPKLSLSIRTNFSPPISRFLPHVWALVLAFLIIWKFWAMRRPVQEQLTSLHKENYTCQLIRPSIGQLSNEESLIYVKAPTSPWHADHHPTICWEGTGFEVRDIHFDTVLGRKIFKAHLVYESDTLYTAWWYDNGTQLTAEQWKWRTWALQGADPFYLINVSAPGPEKLDQQIGRLFEGRLKGLGLE